MFFLDLVLMVFSVCSTYIVYGELTVHKLFKCKTSMTRRQKNNLCGKKKKMFSGSISGEGIDFSASSIMSVAGIVLNGLKPYCGSDTIKNELSKRVYVCIHHFFYIWL